MPSFAFTKTKEYRTVSYLVGIAIALAAAIVATIQYIKISGAVDDVGSVSNNWATPPIVALHAVTSHEECPPGTEQLGTVRWPGADNFCGCPVGAVHDRRMYFTRRGRCTTNATRAGCTDGAEIDGVTIDVWRQGKLCARRGSEAFLTRLSNGSYQQRPSPPCPPDYHMCGSETSRTCFPKSEQCPVTQMELGVSGQFEGEGWETFPYPDGRVVAVRRNGTRLPMIEHIPSFSAPCTGKSPERQFDDEGALGENDYDGSCLRDDYRWWIADTVSQVDFMRPVFAAHPLCTSPTFPAFQFHGAHRGRAAEGYARFVTTHSSCDQLQQYASHGGARQVHQYMRSQIAWKKECPVTPSDIVMNHDWLETIRTHHLGILITVWLSFCCLGFCSGYGIRIVWTGTKKEIYYVSKINAVVGSLVGAAKTAITLALTLTVKTSMEFYINVAKHPCSDPITNETFSILGEEFAKGLDLSWVIISLTGIKFLYAVGWLIWEGCDGISLDLKAAGKADNVPSRCSLWCRRCKRKRKSSNPSSPNLTPPTPLPTRSQDVDVVVDVVVDTRQITRQMERRTTCHRSVLCSALCGVFCGVGNVRGASSPNLTPPTPTPPMRSQDVVVVVDTGRSKV